MINEKHYRNMLSRCLLSASSLLLLCQTANAQTALEYFWNTDPGIGNGTVTYQTAYDPYGSEFDIDISGLQPGVNMLGMRANIKGRWSQTSYRLVAIENGTQGDLNAEYFWNEDPGIGKATPVSLSENDGAGLTSFTIDTTTLHPGVNVFGLRVGSSCGWSSTRTFIINQPVAGDSECLAEYFWDTDPGCGKGTPLSGGALATGSLLEIDVPTEGLTPGAHTLGIRSMSGQTWSTTYTSTVYIAGAKGYGCTYAEYFWGEDPGYGNGTPIDIKPGDSVTVEDLTVDFPTETAEEYVLSFRTRSEQGWSTTVTKILPHLYVEEILLEADTTTMARGTTMQIRSTLTPAEPFDDRITWSSSDENVLTVDETGTVKAVGAGTATITATALDAHGVTGSIDIEVIVPVEAIAIEPAELKLSVTETYTLTAKVTPEDATYTDVEWSCEGEAVTIDEDGNLTAVARGEAIVTATALDGSGASGSCKVTVGYLMGDADDDGQLAVNDVVLTARAVVDDFDTKLVKEAIDMNGDGMISVGDLTLVADHVIAWVTVPTGFPAQRRTAPEYGRITLMPENDGETVAVYVESGTEVTGLQFDVKVSEGLAITSITTGTETGHTARTHMLADGTMRLLSYSAGCNALPHGTAAARIHLARTGETADEATIEVTGAKASDFAGNLFTLGTTWTSLDTSAATEVSADSMTVTTEGRTVIVTVPDNRSVTFTDMKGASRRMAMKKGINRFDVPSGGVYAVDGIKIIIK